LQAEIAHIAALQVVDATFPTQIALQLLPQPPQFCGLLVMLISQPSDGTPLQFAKPELQLDTVQEPLEQAGVPFGALQLLPQPPQLFTLVLVLISQPFAGLPSQFAKPELQLATAQLPATQAGVPLGMLQTLPQPPQLETLLPMLTSQPFAAMPSQSA
jgi:hypothetical protein